MPSKNASHKAIPEPGARVFYRRTLRQLQAAQIPFLVGGAYALGHYTGISRDTKDFDIFLRRDDCERTLTLLRQSGCRTELTYPHWLGKAVCAEWFVDVIFSSGNGIATVDEEWFQHAPTGRVLGLPVKLCPAEEMIWSKSFIMERERFDGADIAHLLLACGQDLDWVRLLRRFGHHWRVLMTHLLLFGFAYPSEREKIPDWVMSELIDRLRVDLHVPPSNDRVCRGTILSRSQYLVDIDVWGYTDGRLAPPCTMSPEDIAHWTAAIEGQP